MKGGGGGGGGVLHTSSLVAKQLSCGIYTCTGDGVLFISSLRSYLHSLCVH